VYEYTFTPIKHPNKGKKRGQRGENENENGISMMKVKG
jgi:hypothetical protein